MQETAWEKGWLNWRRKCCLLVYICLLLCYQACRKLVGIHSQPHSHALIVENTEEGKAVVPNRECDISVSVLKETLGHLKPDVWLTQHQPL